DVRVRSVAAYDAVRRRLGIGARGLFRCWKDGKPYDEQIYLQSLRRRGSCWVQSPASVGSQSPASKNFLKIMLDGLTQKTSGTRDEARNSRSLRTACPLRTLGPDS